MGNKRHFKKGDTVYILSGEDRGASGKVIDVLTSSERVVVEGLNMVKKHIRKNQDQPQGEIAEREGTIHWSNVMREDRYRRNRTLEEDVATEEAGDKVDDKADDKAETKE
jgi:large subunit ribosomal protein L24|tara:strand:- start:53 stop:382 length:330 start_codon:yes stop_codon:yes gene_type:complete